MKTYYKIYEIFAGAKGSESALVEPTWINYNCFDSEEIALFALEENCDNYSEYIIQKVYQYTD